MSTLKKRFSLNWMFECPDAILTCSVLRCGGESYLVFGGHDKTLYLMSRDLDILDTITFDGWVRTTFPIDITGDGCDEVLIGAGDGNFLIVKFVKGINKLAGIMNFKSKGKVLCVTAGDFTQDDNIELIFGSEDKTLKIFENIDAVDPKYILYYDSWVTACTLGYLQLPNEKNPTYGLVLGTKNGALQLIQFKEEKIDIIWQKFFNSQINTIEIGDVTNDGFHEIVIGTDDSKLLILNSNGEELKSIVIDEGRPISLKLVDIDGDNAKEIIVGCADGSLRIYQNITLNSTDIDLKWKTSARNSVKIVSTMIDPKDGMPNIIFGGYDSSIRCICDFEYGEKPSLDIPYNIKITEPSVKSESDLSTEELKYTTVPTNIREYIFKYIIDNKVIQDIALDLEKRGYIKERVVEEFVRLISEKQDKIEKISYSVWTLSEDKIGVGGTVEQPAKKPIQITPIVIEQEIPQAKGNALIDALRKDISQDELNQKQTQPISIVEENLRTIIIHYFEKTPIVESKAKLVNDVVLLGYSEDLVEKLFEKIKDEGIIGYSRSEPKGWYLTNY